MSEGRGTDTQSWAPSGGLERRSRDDREMQQHVAEDDQRYSSATPDLWDPRRSEMRFQEFDHQRCPSSSSSCDGRETRRVREMEGSQRHSDPDQRYGSSTDVREPRRSRELERHSDDQRYSSEPRKSQRSREMEVHSDPNQRYFASTDPKRTRELDTEQDQHYLSGDDRRRSRERDERDSRRSRESETLSDSGQLRYQSSASNTWFMVHQNRRPQQQQQNIFERLDRPQETREHSATYYAGEAVIVHDQRRPTRGKKRPAFSHQVGSFHKRRSTRSPARSDRGSVNCNSPALSSSSSERIFFDSRPSDSTASESPLIIIDELSQTPPSLPPPGTSSISSSPHPSCSLSPPPSPPALTQSPPSLLDIPFPSSPPSESNKPAPTSQTTQPSISQASTATTASQPPPQPPMPTYLSISPPLSSPSLQASPILVPMPISYPAGQGYQYQFFPPLQGFYPTVPTQVYSWPYASQVSTTAVVPSNPSRFDRSRSGTPVMDEPKDSTLVNAPAEETQTEETPAQQTDGQNPSHVDKEITQVDSENEQSFNAKMDVTENKTSSHTQETETHAQETLTEAQGTESHAQETLTEAQGTGTHAQETLTEAQGTETHVQEALTEAQGTETHAQEALTEAQGTETHAQETLTEAQGTETETHAQETLTETQGTETHVQEALTEPQGTETHNQKTDADVQVTDSHTQEPDVVMQLTEPHSKEDTVCQSSTDQTLEHDEQPAVETGAQSGDTLESHSQTTTDDIITQIVPISPASCPEQASEPSHTDNEPGDDGQLAVPSTMTDLEIEEAMEEEEDRGIDSDQESMTSEVFSPLTFQVRELTHTHLHSPTPTHTHLHTHSPTHPLTHTLTHSHTHLLTHSLTHTLTHALTHPLDLFSTLLHCVPVNV